MSFAPHLLTWALLVLFAGLSLTVGHRSRTHGLLPALGLLLALLVALFLRPQEPPSLDFAGWSFAMTPAARQLVIPALLLGLAAAAPLGLRALQTSETSESARLPGAIGLLVAAALLALWSADLFTLAAAYTLFVAVWLAVLAWRRAFARPALWLLGPLFLVWLAAALALAGETSAGWQRYTVAALLAGAWLAAGAWPASVWRPSTEKLSPALRAVMAGLPVILAAAVVSPLAVSGAFGQLQLILVTVLALLGFALGLRTAWASPVSLRGLIEGLAPALAGVALLVAVWASPRALFAAVHLAVFVPALLLLIPSGMAASGQRRDDEASHPMAEEAGVDAGGPVGWRRDAGRRAALGLSYAALAGIPLTAGFATLAPLYAAWSSGFRLALLVVLALLVTFWLAAVAWFILKSRAAGASLTLPDGIGLALAALGLLWLDLSAPRGLPALVWLALVTPLAAGLVLPRLLAGRDEWRALLGESLAVRPTGAGLPALRRFGVAAGGAVADAISILDGESGLLWLLALLALFFLAA